MKRTEEGIEWEVIQCSVELCNEAGDNLTRDDIIAMAKSLFVTGEDLI